MPNGPASSVTDGTHLHRSGLIRNLGPIPGLRREALCGCSKLTERQVELITEFGKFESHAAGKQAYFQTCFGKFKDYFVRRGTTGS